MNIIKLFFCLFLGGGGVPGREGFTNSVLFCFVFFVPNFPDL